MKNGSRNSSSSNRNIHSYNHNSDTHTNKQNKEDWGRLEPRKHGERNEKLQPVLLTVSFLSLFFTSSNTKRPNVAVCSQKSCLFLPMSVSLTPASSSSRPLGDTRRAAIGQSSCLGGTGRPIRSCKRRANVQGANERSRGAGPKRAKYVIGELMMKNRDGS